MRKFIALALMLLTLTAFGQQTTDVYSGSFQNTAIEQVINDIEGKLSYTFYYKKEWIDSLTFSGNFSNTPISEVLTTIFDGTTIRFYHDSKKVFLTNGIAIITTPEIVSDLLAQHSPQQAEQPAEETKELLFTKEYAGENQNNNDLENFVFEVGSRAQFEGGASSTMVGYIKDNSTGEPIEGALVYSGNKAAVTGPDGFYSLNLTNGRHEIQVQFTGMKRTKRKIILFSNGRFDIDMEVDVIALNEVIVEATRRANIEQVNTGIERLNVEDSKTVPAVLGEKDILKVATTFAGIQTVGEGAAGFNVRGGKSDQNLFLFEGATVYNASHFLGFFSVFNSDALEGMNVMKSGIPASYGGRLSSVFDISAKTPNKEEVTVEGGISSVTSRLTAEIPIIKEKASLLASGRLTYSNWILETIDHSDFKNNKVNFSDFIVKYDHQINQENRVSLSGYLSEDKFRLNSDTLFSFSDFSYANKMATAKWSRRFNATFDASLSASYSEYDYEFESTQLEKNAFGQDYGIREFGAKLDFNKDLQSPHQLNFGLEAKRYDINPGTKFPIGSESVAGSISLSPEQGIEGALYVSDNHEINDKLSLNYGLRYSFFTYLGPGITNLYLDDAPKNPDTKTGEIIHDKGDFIETYHGPELRFAARYLLDDNSSVKLSYDRSRQYLHALSNSASLSPTDLWRLSNEYIEPQVGDQISVGYYRDFLNGEYETSVEVYGKKLSNLVDFKTGADFLLNDRIETIALQGPGKSYGVEFSLKKDGRLNGWFNYSYARTFIKLDGSFDEETINNGSYFPTNYDKPHTINLVSNYEITTRFSVSYNFVYNTGRPITFPTGLYELNGIEILNYSDRNEYRIPDYVRMDIGLTLKWGHRLTKGSHSFWSVSVYNVLGRKNAFSLYFDLDDGEVQGYKLSVFGSAIPTISYNFKF
ncbi:TonB-dependent receptor-like protein [Roseivirga pacifica]|uniref:TonB-dependent Receptor Plug Domain n=1 Tax=Roseivirga pacifica TaxID=1267423 RepID=A0A1I0QVH5_9BACT|nr:carboxypeptidase-like regulatory domain-containing protein [Roseivirga pacifica]RKQ42493.1 TonB-dependent receptor-like protein [Roseivirga pacifica]SEW31643.1 TonB-dependent Receptor Plug Domain [Roseivirga pacifica]